MKCPKYSQSDHDYYLYCCCYCRIVNFTEDQIEAVPAQCLPVKSQTPKLWTMFLFLTLFSRFHVPQISFVSLKTDR